MLAVRALDPLGVGPLSPRFAGEEGVSFRSLFICDGWNRDTLFVVGCS